MKRESSKEAVRRGRPAKPEGEALDAVIPSARCKKDERKAFERAAKQEGLTLTQWVRLTLNRAVEK
jgi:uncharacterized protein (DUF1778 family)